MKTNTKVQTRLAEMQEEYAEILATEKELSDRKEAIVSMVNAHFDESGDTVWGFFFRQPRKTLSWKIGDIQKIFGRRYQLFMKPDNAAIKAMMPQNPGLEVLAEVKVTNAVMFAK